MNSVRTFSAATEDALWQQVAADLSQQPDLLTYAADLTEGSYLVRLTLEIDLGGGFEGGFETTSFNCLVPAPTPLRFSLHKQDWVHEIGKLLGLTDIELGDPALDAAFIITTNSPDVLRDLLLSDPDLRQTLLRHPDARLALAPASEEPDAAVYLLFTKDEAITEPGALREVYHLIISLLRQIAPLPAQAAG